eukprot:4632917-Pleurochrysis_carterae.AAC.1
MAFDNLEWRFCKNSNFSRDYELVPIEFDLDDEAVRAVLMGRKGASLNLPAGFLLSNSPTASAATPTGWELFHKYVPAPLEKFPARYATPPIAFPLSIGDPVEIQPPFVSLSGTR